MKKEPTKLDFETLKVFLILSILTVTFWIGVQMVVFAPSFNQVRSPTEVRSQIDPRP
jgi:hypothetical protein